MARLGAPYSMNRTQMLIPGLYFDGRAFERLGHAEDHRTWSSRDCTGFYLLRLVSHMEPFPHLSSLPISQQ